MLGKERKNEGERKGEKGEPSSGKNLTGWESVQRPGWSGGRWRSGGGIDAGSDTDLVDCPQ